MKNDPYENSLDRKRAAMSGADSRLPEAVRLLDLWRDYDCCFRAGSPPSREQERDLIRQTDAFLGQTSVKVWRVIKRTSPNTCDDARPLGAVASGALFEETAGKTSVNSKLQ